MNIVYIPQYITAYLTSHLTVTRQSFKKGMF